MTEQQEVQTNGQTPPPSVTEEPKPEAKDFVSRKDHERALEDMHKFKREREELLAKLKSEEDNKLKEKEQWKTLYEKEKTRADELEMGKKQLNDSFVNSQKFSALKTECLKMGILESAMVDLDMVDMSGIKIETTSTGRLNILNAKEFAEDLKRVRPHWFGTPGVTRVNTSTPQVIGSGEVTYDQVRKLEEQWRKTRSPSDEAAYRKALLSMKGVKS